MGAWSHALAATLLLAAPLVAFLKTNQYPLASAETGLLLGACAAAGALLAFATSRIPLGAALILGGGLALSVDLIYGTRFSGTGLAFALVICLALAMALRRHIALVVAAASSVFLAATVLLPSSAAQDRSRGPGAEAAPRPAARDLPVLVHLILDEHIGIDGLPRELAGSAELARRLTDDYVSQGFLIHAGAYSEYFDTRNSMANLLNFTSEDGDWAHLAEGKSKPYVLTESAYFRHLTELGYRLRVYQSDYLDYCRVPGVSYAACSRYRSNSIGSLPSTPLAVVERARFIFNSLLGTSRYLKRLRAAYAKVRAAVRSAALPAWEHGASRVGPLAVLPVLKQLEQELRSASRGRAYFAHLMMPHYPYVLDEACRVREKIGQWLNNDDPHAPSELEPNTAVTRAERYRNYFAQIRCQQVLLNRLFDALKDAGVWHDAIVILHGDHGSRIVQRSVVAQNAARLTREDFNDGFSTLFAVRLPGRGTGVVRGARPLQELLSEALGLPSAQGSRKVYLRTADEKGFTPFALSGFRGHEVSD